MPMPMPVSVPGAAHAVAAHRPVAACRAASSALALRRAHRPVALQLRLRAD